MKKKHILIVFFTVRFFIQSIYAQNDSLEKPLLLPSTDISFNQFTANWQAVASADSYLLHVWTVDTVNEQNKTISSTVFSSINNWIINNSGTSTNYWQFLTTNSSITSPSIDFTNYLNVKLTINARTYGSVSNNSADISIYIDTTKIATITPTTTTLQNYTVNIPVSDIASIRLVTENAGSNRGAGVASVSLYGDYSGIIPNSIPNAPFSTTDTFYTVAGLQESTQYYYSVTAIKDTFTYTSDEEWVTTCSFFPPTLFDATNIQFAEFTAHWSTVPVANSYLVDVWTADTNVKPNTLISSTSFSMIDNWIINNSGTSANYWQFTTANSNITSPIIDFLDYSNVILTVNARTYGGASNNSEDISIYVNATKAATITPTSTTLTNYTVTIPVSGIAAIQLIMESAGSGRGVGIASVNLQGDYAEITRYPLSKSPFSTTDTFYLVTGLQDSTTYHYAVSAVRDSVMRISAIGNMTTSSLPTYTISASCGENGSITPYGDTTIVHGGWISYTILPDIGYHIDSVFVNEVYQTDIDGSSLTYIFNNVKNNYTIRAVFSINYYTLSANCGENGSISPIGDTVVSFNQEVTYTFFPNADYSIDSVFIDDVYCAEAVLQKAYTFSNIRNNHSIYATFAIKKDVIPILNNAHLKIHTHRNTIYLENEHNIPIQSIKIWDVSGRLIRQYDYFIPAIELKTNGMYILQIMDFNQRISNYRISIY